MKMISWKFYGKGHSILKEFQGHQLVSIGDSKINIESIKGIEKIIIMKIETNSWKRNCGAEQILLNFIMAICI